MSVTTFIVNAFADAPFSGNPAAVCLPDGERDEGWLQRVAAEMNLSETAFLIPCEGGEWRLRWFTPMVEVDLCGHATLASAHVLWNELGSPSAVLRFHTRSGVLTASRADGQITLDFPADPPVPAARTDALIDGLGIEPEYVGRGRDDLMVVVSDAEQVRRLRPDFSRLAQVPTRGIMVTAPGDRADRDFVSRFFAPRAGILEDPVTGSAHCVLGPYWGERLGKSVLRGYQLSARGGAVGVCLAGERVRLLGSAITVLEGRLRG